MILYEYLVYLGLYVLDINSFVNIFNCSIFFFCENVVNSIILMLFNYIYLWVYFFGVFWIMVIDLGLFKFKGVDEFVIMICCVMLLIYWCFWII